MRASRFLSCALAWLLVAPISAAQKGLPVIGDYAWGQIGGSTVGSDCAADGLDLHGWVGTASFDGVSTVRFSGVRHTVCALGSSSMPVDASGFYGLALDGTVIIDMLSGDDVGFTTANFHATQDVEVIVGGGDDYPAARPFAAIMTKRPAFAAAGAAPAYHQTSSVAPAPSSLGSGVAPVIPSDRYHLARIGQQNGPRGPGSHTDIGSLFVSPGGSFYEETDRHVISALHGTKDEAHAAIGSITTLGDGTVFVSPGGGEGGITADGDVLFWLLVKSNRISLTVAARQGVDEPDTILDGAWRYGFYSMHEPQTLTCILSGGGPIDFDVPNQTWSRTADMVVCMVDECVPAPWVAAGTFTMPHCGVALLVDPDRPAEYPGAVGAGGRLFMLTTTAPETTVFGLFVRPWPLPF